MSDGVELERLLTAARAAGRGELKRMGAQLDTLEGEKLRESLFAWAAERGLGWPEDARYWPGKKMIRRALERDEAAQVRTTPVMRDEAFVCAHCGLAVPPLGVTARDHCPRCLRSLHVDVVPGDRANTCGGLMDPIGVELAGDRVTILYRCRKCGESHRNRALLEGEMPDQWRSLVKVSAGVQL